MISDWPRVKRERDRYVDEVTYDDDVAILRLYRETSPAKPEQGGRTRIRPAASRSPSVSYMTARARPPSAPDYSPCREKDSPSHPFSNSHLQKLRDLAMDIECFGFSKESEFRRSKPSDSQHNNNAHKN